MPFLRVLGWIFVPYIMVLARWRRLSALGRTGGTFWGIVGLLWLLGTIVAATQSARISATAPVTTSVSHSPPVTVAAPGKKKEKQRAQDTGRALSLLKSLPPIGETVKMNGLLFTVLNAQIIHGQAPDPGAHEFFGVFLQVGNDTSQTQNLSDSQFALASPVGAEGTAALYPADSTAEQAFPTIDGIGFPNLQVLPGMQVQSYLVFDVPLHMSRGYIVSHYDLDMLSGPFAASSQEFSFLAS